MNTKQTNHGVFQHGIHKYLKAEWFKMYGLQGNVYMKFGVASEWPGYLPVLCRETPDMLIGLREARLIFCQSQSS